jgi:hypothetical protein
LAGGKEIDGIDLLAFIGEPLNSEGRPFKGVGNCQVVEVSRVDFPSLVLLIDDLILQFIVWIFNKLIRAILVKSVSDVRDMEKNVR